METKLQQEINNVLSVFPEYWNEDILLKNKLIEDVRSYNENLIEALLSNELIRDTYSLQLSSGVVFKVEDFISMLRFKNYWDNSYTKYTNEIGLTSESKYLNYNTDVVLDFPHKDSVLEGGMTKEHIGKKEVYYHNILAKEEIDTLFSPKILFNTKKFDQNGEHNVSEFKDKDNLIIKGNNLIALHTLKERYENKVKLIYIDIPYNTGNDSFKYNDRFSRSTWLTFMMNRIKVAKDLLATDGVIFIQCDNHQHSYLKVLLDNIFKEENFRNNIVWRKVLSAKRQSSNLSNITEYILVYSKTEEYEVNKIFLKTKQEKDFKNYPYIEEETGRRYGSFDFTQKGQGNSRFFNGKLLSPPKNKHWIWDQERIDEGLAKGLIVFTKSGTPRVKRYLDEKEGNPLSDLWNDDDVKIISANDKQREVFDGQKPEGLLKRIIELATEEGDLVLDFFMGTGTTQAVAHKLNRQYIGVEQMNYINDISIPRLQRVISGEKGGISKEVEWQGGGSFVYAELYNLNEEYLQTIQDCSSTEALAHVIDKMKTSAYLNFKVDLDKVTAQNESFKTLSLEEQKDVLIQVLDMNQLYLNYSEMEDSQYGISDSVKAFNHSFYQKEGDTDE